MERLTPEQIRLLEELRELRDSGILTGDEFEFQVAKVLGRPLVVEPLPVDEELSAPEDIPVAELLEYVFVESATSYEGGIREEENRAVESPTTSDISASPIADIGSQQNKSGRRKIVVGAVVGFIVVSGIALIVLGGGESNSTSSQVIGSTTTVTQSTVAVTTQAPTTSTTTTTEVIPTTTYEVLQCPYTRVIEAVDGKIVTPEGITFAILPTTYKSVRSGDGYSVSVDKYVPYKFGDIEVTNSTNFRLRIGMEVRWYWADDSVSVSWEPDNGRGFLNGFGSRVIQVPRTGIFSVNPVTNLRLEMVSATTKYLCP